MAEHGVNAVRIPVGYWVLEGDAPYVEATTYLDWAMSMAEQYRLEVIIDVHGLQILDPVDLETRLNQLAGVVTSGLFARKPADVCLLGTEHGVITLCADGDAA